jgi:hypothetical protein
MFFLEDLVVIHDCPGWIDGDCFLQPLGHAHAVRLRRRLEVAIDAVSGEVVKIIQWVGRNLLDFNGFLLVVSPALDRSMVFVQVCAIFSW